MRETYAETSSVPFKIFRTSFPDFIAQSILSPRENRVRSPRDATFARLHGQQSTIYLGRIYIYIYASTFLNSTATHQYLTCSVSPLPLTNFSKIRKTPIIIRQLILRTAINGKDNQSQSGELKAVNFFFPINDIRQSC